MKDIAILKSKMGAQGGLEKYADRIIRGFIEKGCKVHVLATSSGLRDRPQTLSGSFHFCKTASWPPFLKLEQFDRFTRDWLQKNKADLIFGMDRNRFQTHLRAGNGVHAAYLESRKASEGKWKKMVCSFNPLHRKILELEKAGFENPSLQKLFANSYMARDQILSYYNVDSSKIQVIHNGVEWDEMQGDFDAWEQGRASALAEWGLKSDCFHFLFIGNGYKRKGLDPLLEALAKLQMRDFHLSVVGKDKALESYKAKASHLGLSSQVRFFGPQPKIGRFYQLADALIIPSFYDPFANVTVEALAFGLFVVSSKQNGGHEILSAENGFVIKNLLDFDSISEGLKAALNRPKTPVSAVSIRQSVKRLDFSTQIKRLMDACE